MIWWLFMKGDDEQSSRLTESFNDAAVHQLITDANCVALLLPVKRSATVFAIWLVCILSQWRIGKLLDLWSVGHGFNSHQDKAAYQPWATCAHVCVSVTKQNNLILGRLLLSAGKVTAYPAESNGSLLPGDDFACRLTACTLGSASGPTLGNEYGRTWLLPYIILDTVKTVIWRPILLIIIWNSWHFTYCWWLKFLDFFSDFEDLESFGKQSDMLI